MDAPADGPDTRSFFKSLGFPDLRVHRSFNHFDFTRPSRRILVIGSMGSGKTEFSARVWRDAEVARTKTGAAAEATRTDGADRRVVFFIRSALDRARFPQYPADALPYRSGYVRCGPNIAEIADSFDLERVIADNPGAGTWIVDEASFYEERLAYVVEEASRRRGLTFIFPSLILNFRREIFNTTARLLLDVATDVFPLTAYCEHPECIADSFYTYRYYTVDGAGVPGPVLRPAHRHRRRPRGAGSPRAELLHPLRRAPLPAGQGVRVPRPEAGRRGRLEGRRRAAARRARRPEGRHRPLGAAPGLRGTLRRPRRGGGDH